ncbi:MAG: CsgG/HfaB family protein [bacterium]
MFLKNRLLLCLSVLFLCQVGLLAQNKTRIAVAEFTVKVPKAAPVLGTAMADLLTNALVQTGQFTVLEREAINRLRDEQDLALGGEVDASTGAEFGKLIGAEYLVVGSVTKFEEKGGGGIGGLLSRKIGVGVAKNTSELAITIRIIDSTTGEIVSSDKISQKESKIGLVGGGVIMGVPMAGGLFKSKAMQTALEKAIVKAVDIIKTKIKPGDPNAPQVTRVEWIVSNCSFKIMKKLTKMLKSLPGVTGVKRTFRDHVASFKFFYEGTTDDLAEAVDEKKPGSMELDITGFSEHKMEMEIK